jgi:hypothetical protein
MSSPPRAPARRVAILLALVLAVPAAAQECPRPPSASARGLAGRTDQERLLGLAALASREDENFGTWRLLSGAGFALLVIGQLGLAHLVPAETRPDYFLGAAYSALGTASTLVGAPAVFERGEAFAREAAAATPATRCALIAEGERLLEQSAAQEAQATKWYMHLLNVAVNLSLGAILGFGYGHWTNAALDTGVGIALSEAVLLTRPHALDRAWRSYLGVEEGVVVRLSAIPTLGGPVALGVSTTF